MAGSEGSVVVDLADLFDQLNQNALSEFRADEVNDDIFGSLNGLLLKHLIAQRLTVFTGCTNVVYQESNVCDAALALVELGQNARMNSIASAPLPWVVKIRWES